MIHLHVSTSLQIYTVKCTGYILYNSLKGTCLVWNKICMWQQPISRERPARLISRDYDVSRKAPPPARLRTLHVRQLNTFSLCNNRPPRAQQQSARRLGGKRRVWALLTVTHNMEQRTLVRKQQRERQKQARTPATLRWQRFKSLRKSFADARVTLDESNVTGEFVCLSLIIKIGGKCRLAWAPNRAVPLPTGARERTRARISRRVTSAAERLRWDITRTVHQVRHHHHHHHHHQRQLLLTISAPGRALWGVVPVARTCDPSRALIYRTPGRIALKSPVTAHRRRTAERESGQPAPRDC